MAGTQISQKLTIHRPDLTGLPASKFPQQPVRTQVVKKMHVEEEPDLAEMAVNITKAAGKWISAGLPVVSQAVYDQRTDICDGCELWDKKGNLGMGKCKAPGCGCTRFKRWLATEACKHPQGSKWPALPTPDTPPAPTLQGPV